MEDGAAILEQIRAEDVRTVDFRFTDLRGQWQHIGVAAGAVVTKDVADFALVAGVPARRIGWVGPAGVPLTQVSPGRFRCPTNGDEYDETDGQLVPAADGR